MRLKHLLEFDDIENLNSDLEEDKPEEFTDDQLSGKTDFDDMPDFDDMTDDVTSEPVMDTSSLERLRDHDFMHIQHDPESPYNPTVLITNSKEELLNIKKEVEKQKAQYLLQQHPDAAGLWDDETYAYFNALISFVSGLIED